MSAASSGERNAPKSIGRSRGTDQSRPNEALQGFQAVLCDTFIIIIIIIFNLRQGMAVCGRAVWQVADCLQPGALACGLCDGA